MKIKKKKMFKSKYLFLFSFFNEKKVICCVDGKIQIFCHKYLFQMKSVISLLILAKKRKGWSDNVETIHKEKSGVFEEKNLENENFIAAALHAQIGFQRSDQSQSSILGQPTNGGPVLNYFLSETIHAQENGSIGTYFAKFLIFNFLDSLTYSAMVPWYEWAKFYSTTPKKWIFGPKTA